ncbi:chemotaxis response regulator protein-glutamate methylesterase of group 3 operon [Desulfuromonas versatilis]|uniref:Protein-glutamate methylesterase/protein-glutamine glutaminase n=2 Tax=Desulfuromonas versatilis TaxID=2802975 RepID=A0ABN6DYB2_9BACT|nr:chemotaxis response regulator protein-glutamate methylesterase [Desulfuromonas versatilis]BCR05118.1 chemotaxis response regulator protein-glutamate methylesterase of group 3 operon [Desulfuromonas versatilis]
MTSPLRILVIDDSAFNRRTIAKMLEAIPGVEVVGDACDGEEGLRKVFDLQPDLVTLDLAMPRMDGFGFLRIVMEQRPTPVIVVSALAEDENVFKALELGAVEFIPKPSARVSPELVKIREDLVQKVLQVARTDLRKVLTRTMVKPPCSAGTRLANSSARQAISHVVIGASTGGPPALQAIFSAIQEPVPIAFAVSQHMPPVFTRAFAERLNKYSHLEIAEAKSGDLLLPGRVLVAPGGRNLVFTRVGDEVSVQVVEPREGQRYVPSVDAMFTSAAEVFGADLLGVVLTGMGNDGAQGVLDIKKAGGQALAEAEETSVVFGMPKEAIATGKVDKVVPLPLICSEILRRCYN